MTPQEAIKNIDVILDSPYLCDESIDYQLTTDDIECLEMSKKALEKQIPKKTLWGGTNNASWRSCPECHSRENKTHKYCSQCGQALDWSDTE